MKRALIVLIGLMVLNASAGVAYRSVKFRADFKICVLNATDAILADEVWLHVDSPEKADIVITSKKINKQKLKKIAFVEYGKQDKSILITTDGTKGHVRTIHITDEHLKMQLIAK